MKKSASKSVVGALVQNINGQQLDGQSEGAGFNSPTGNWIKNKKHLVPLVASSKMDRFV